MIKVQGGAQNYGWGRKGSASWVSQFISNVSEELPYAEYWLGTHPSLPSTVNGRLLSSVTGDLPYLFKILSISKPLSIQLHPNKAQAIRLHELSPVLYPDSNYKPEMCIARDRMKLFIGFKPLQEISEVINSTPELDYLKNYPNLASKLSRLYENEAETRELVSKYCERVGLGLYWDINQQFPNDPGVFFSMFMNYVELSEGESIIIHAGIPHCYIEGECIEAMACSDNVVRAGLTPKAKDINTLLEIADYSHNPPFVSSGNEIEFGVSYDTPYEEFKVIKYSSLHDFTIKSRLPALGFVTKGSGEADGVVYNTGDSVLVQSDVYIRTEGIEIFLCLTNPN